MFELSSSHFDGVRTLRALCCVKGYFVAFAEFVECNSLKLVGVKEEILLYTLPSDEAKSTVRKTRYCSLIHCSSSLGKVSKTGGCTHNSTTFIMQNCYDEPNCNIF